MMEESESTLRNVRNVLMSKTKRGNETLKDEEKKERKQSEDVPRWTKEDSREQIYLQDRLQQIQLERTAATDASLPIIEVDNPYIPDRKNSVIISPPQDDTIKRFGGTQVEEKMKNLVEAFKERTEQTKIILTRPPSPEVSESHGSDNSKKNNESSIEDAIVKHESKEEKPKDIIKFINIVNRLKPNKVFHSKSNFSIFWLGIVAACFLYNVFVIPLRSVFPYQAPSTYKMWFCFDYIADVVYLLDIILYKPRIIYLKEGFWETDIKETAKHYFKSVGFKIDLLSLLPLDILYLAVGVTPLLRFPRFLKVFAFWQFFDELDKVMSNPHYLRILRTFTYMVYLIHLIACIYYIVSSYEGIASNLFVYDGKGNAYLRCFYFATKTATSIGKNPKPTNLLEYVVMSCCWLTGVFIFAMLIGQIRDILAISNRSHTEYQATVDGIVTYMTRLNLVPSLQYKVRQWLTYTWEQQKSLDENLFLRNLSKKLQQDVAVGVHIQTLSKVQMFKECDPRLLLDLVTVLKPMIYLPGDYICKTGDVGKEMFIIKSGLVEVVVGDGKVVATLEEGSVFGEIALLGTGGQNRRTANIRSKGFSNLFVLTKHDLYEVLKDYPEAEAILQKKANELAQKGRKNQDNNKLKAKVIIPNKSQPKMLDTVMQALPLDSCANQLLRRGSQYTVKRKKKISLFKQIVKDMVIDKDHLPPVEEPESSGSKKE